MSPRILVIAGSLRAGSHNRRLAAEATRLLAQRTTDVSVLDLADHALPIFDADMEAADGLPAAAIQLAERIEAQDGLLLVSPEYNASVSPLLKNAIDWASRVRKVKGRPVQPFKDLVVGLAAASPGRLGGLRGLQALRAVCQSLGAEVLTAQVTLADAGNAFDEDDHLTDDHARLSLERLVEALHEHSQALGRHTP
ncbi:MULTISPECIES: NADPH-dependent FMN reductase [unclassified Aureimonas]|uniref:NADPH-dependent FMN reductase n=1 Tax=unclassified Aureimonas TaxID=2615206 RepID=UPI0006F484D7|nr:MULTISPECIES: NAD(P)H-dependent oxidoreductase [unclassified Aureimonas]KQT64420.1 NADPH-dependent FMN reductase [Aureimonas sp. Leaf427]KQT81610.1 NADPH-dependent FMN reductase [Aureimonas sp. Leaf460]